MVVNPELKNYGRNYIDSQLHSRLKSEGDNFMAIAYIVDYPQELFNDARVHLALAEQAEIEGDVYGLWQEVRVTVILAITTVESLLNKIAGEYLRNNGNLDLLIVNYLQMKKSYMKNGIIKSEIQFVNIEEKLRGWTRIITGNEYDLGDHVWQNFKVVLDYRNELIHYKPQRGAIVYNEGTINMARQAINSTIAVIERFYECWGQDLPPWVE